MKFHLVSLFLLIFAFPLYSSAKPLNEAEVIHWWVSGGERAALQTVIDAFEAGGNKWIDTPVESSYYAKTAAISRLLNGKPPAAVQWHAGVSLQQLYGEGLFRNINELAENQQWKKVLPETIWNNITVGGKVVAIPITLHGSNWIWGNKKILDELKITLPRTWDEFMENAEIISKAGYYPLALGGQPWQERALFLTIVLGLGGPELYENTLVLHEQEALLSPGMIKAFETFGALRKYIDPESPKRSWSDTTQLVIEGKAAFQIMGDWVKGEFFQAGLVPDKDFLCALSPGSNDNYLIISDVFAMGNVEDENVQKSQIELAKSLMDRDVQKKFSLLKGSIPPRTDVSSDGFDKCSQLAMNIVSRKGAALSGFNMANTGIVASGIMTVISSYWNDPTISPEEATRMLAEAVAKAQK